MPVLLRFLLESDRRQSQYRSVSISTTEHAHNELSTTSRGEAPIGLSETRHQRLADFQNLHRSHQTEKYRAHAEAAHQPTRSRNMAWFRSATVLRQRQPAAVEPLGLDLRADFLPRMIISLTTSSHSPTTPSAQNIRSVIRPRLWRRMLFFSSSSADSIGPLCAARRACGRNWPR